MSKYRAITDHKIIVGAVEHGEFAWNVMWNNGTTRRMTTKNFKELFEPVPADEAPVDVRGIVTEILEAWGVGGKLSMHDSERAELAALIAAKLAEARGS